MRRIAVYILNINVIFLVQYSVYIVCGYSWYIGNWWKSIRISDGSPAFI